MTARPRRHAAARGFSLIEVMLSLVLLAAGIGLAFATLRNATVATERAETSAQRQERLRAVQAFLRRQLDGAMTQPMEFDEATGDAKVFVADDGGIAFVAPMPGYLSRGGPYLQRFRLARGDGGGLQLEFEHRLLTPDGPLEAEREPEILLTPGLIPRHVRLRRRMQDENSPWPELVAAPRLGAMMQPTPLDADPGVEGVEGAEE